MESIEKKLLPLNAPVRSRLRSIFRRRRKPFEVYGLLSEFLSTNGKLLRPALCLCACRAVGGKARQAVSAATAIEMFHNFTLIHDDIEDESRMRRGRPCMHVKYGLPLALNSGDGLFMMVWQEALRLGGSREMKAQRLLLSAFTNVLEGQARELGWYWKKRWSVKPGEYYQVVGGKTGALISVSCEVGGLLGGADAKTCKALRDFGMGIGIGFQMIDDLLNIVGDEKKYGKEIGGDIREGKRTLLTIYALRMLPGARRRRLWGLLKKEGKGKADVSEAIRLIKESGAPTVVKAAAEKKIASAMRCLQALPENEGKRNLTELAGYITRRKR
ncbi:TPA: polyprenyl synthetase family protein [Candidatus Micrarchaeota archaeon]|nr:polyprenyl synthetase family protein [Candidatus Micrarchaeota archaeon]HIH30981.1 polyprenyl synthetase family protein [Candidatus Micrarchaeota archaeon]